jgi:hypothetical protein
MKKLLLLGLLLLLLGLTACGTAQAASTKTSISTPVNVEKSLDLTQLENEINQIKSRLDALEYAVYQRPWKPNSPSSLESRVIILERTLDAYSGPQPGRDSDRIGRLEQRIRNLERGGDSFSPFPN